MPASLIQYRLTIRNASTLANPDGTADELVVTSVPSGTNPFIADAPSGDGQEVDPITGAVRTGAYTVQIVDANTGTDGTGTIRVLTNKLEDATFRQQLISRRAIVEVRTDGGAWQTLVSGFIAGVRLVSPMRYEVTVGDSRRVERTQTIFQGGALGSYTTRGCITGGPVTATWGPVRSRGGWRYRLAISGNDVVATFVDGYESGQDAPLVTDWRKLANPDIASTIEAYRQVNPYALGGGSEYVTSYTTPVYSFAAGDWVVAGGILVYAGSSATNAVAQRALLVGPAVTPATESLGVSKLYLYWPGCPFSNGQVVHISLTTFLTTERTPLYLDAHPVDLATEIWTNARIEYDTTAASNIKALVGSNVRLACRFTEPPTIADFLEKAIFGPFGISARTNAAGKQQLFATRIRTSTTPSLTLATNDLRSAEPLVFDLDEQTAISAITLKQKIFNAASYIAPTTQQGYADSTQGRVPSDGVLISDVEQTSQYLDPNLTVFTGRNITYDIPGMIHTADDWAPATTSQLDAISLGIFDRFGRGCQTSEAQVLAGASAAAAQVGDELYYDVAHFPNKGYRIGESSVGPRIMQVVRRTETPSGPVFKLLDSGLAAQPATAATISIAQNPFSPTAIAQFTITNAATLNATGVISVRVQWATGATTPTSGADFATYAPAAIPTAAVNLPSVTTPGTTVWVRARSEQAGRRPSAWTAWTSVTLAAVAAPSGVSATDIRRTSARIQWTNTSTVYPLVLFAFQGASAPANWLPYRVGTLPVGTTDTVIRTLTGPSINWVIGVAYETPNGLGVVGTVSVTTTTTLTTANRPAALAIIPGVDDATLTQGVALALWPTDQTFDIVIERSLFSGTGFSEIARVSGTTPVYVDERPRNGLTWFYRIAHILGGFSLSPYTPEVSSVATGVPRDLVRPGAVVPVVEVATTETSTQGTVTLTITDPQNRLQQVRFRERTGGGAWGAWVVDSTVPYSYTGTLPGSGFLDIQYEVTAYNGAGELTIVAGGVQSFDRGTTANIVSAAGSFTTAGVLTVAVQADTDTNSFRYAVATSPWANDAAAYAAAQAGTLVNARNDLILFPGPYALGSTVYVAFAAYTGASGTGSVSGPYRYAFVNGSSQPPSLNIVTTPGSPNYSLVITWDGTIAYSLDGVTQSVSGWTSPRTQTIARNAAGGASKVAAFAVTKNGTTISQTVTIPPEDPTVVNITAFTITYDYTNDYIEYNYTLTGLPTSYDIKCFALLNGIGTGELIEVSSSSTQTIVGSPVPLDTSGTVTNNWEHWFEVTDAGVQVLATSISVYGTTYEP